MTEQLTLSEFDHIKTYEADSRGRITLGTDWADGRVKVVVVRREDGGDNE